MNIEPDWHDAELPPDVVSGLDGLQIGSKGVHEAELDQRLEEARKTRDRLATQMLNCPAMYPQVDISMIRVVDRSGCSYTVLGETGKPSSYALSTDERDYCCNKSTAFSYGYDSVCDQDKRKEGYSGFSRSCVYLAVMVGEFSRGLDGEQQVDSQHYVGRTTGSVWQRWCTGQRGNHLRSVNECIRSSTGKLPQLCHATMRQHSGELGLPVYVFVLEADLGHTLNETEAEYIRILDGVGVLGLNMKF